MSLQTLGSLIITRFNRIGWASNIIACGKENGELDFYDSKLLLSKDSALIKRSNIHSGPVLGLDFNPIQKNLLCSGALDGEVLNTN